mgnify:CR=1 FL=1
MASTRAGELEALYSHAPDQDSNQIGNDAQQRVRSLLTAAGMTISSSQVLPSKEESGLERIPLSVRAEEQAFALLALQAPVAGDLRAIVSGFQIVADEAHRRACATETALFRSRLRAARGRARRPRRRHPRDQPADVRGGAGRRRTAEGERFHGIAGRNLAREIEQGFLDQARRGEYGRVGGKQLGVAGGEVGGEREADADRKSVV